VAGAVAVGAVALAVGPAVERYDDLDASGETWGREIVEATFAAVEQDAVIVSWWSFSTPLWYGQHVEGSRPDVTVIDDRDILDDGFGTAERAVAAYLGERPVYVIRHDRDLEALQRDFRLEPVPDVPMALYRVVPEGTDR
jgi:hypothetical protein